MEDKWFIYYEEPHLFFHRSWTGEPFYKLTLRKTPEGFRVEESMCSRTVASDAHSDPAHNVEVLDFLISNLLLGESNPFPVPASQQEPQPGVLQHIIAGTGYPERSLPSKAPWWRFW